MRHDRLFYGLLTGLFVLFLFSAGCGKKGDPIPPRIIRPAPIVDLSVVSAEEGILLTWTLPGPLQPIGSFKLLRSETVKGSEACPGCPQEYRPLRTVTVADDRLHRAEERKFSYVDGDVSVGHYYSYRLVVCNPAGVCGAESNPAGLIHTAAEGSVKDLRK
ncbi:MAG: hypothetical protein C0390_00415 [Syntrophus sp. (in: bacteria)]|nr:hypothetical protein [Syntrophus sp. (in: bacteria)]